MSILLKDVSTVKIPILISFVSEIRDGPRKEKMSFASTGHYYIKEDTSYLSFEEPHEDGKVQTMIKASGSEVMIRRSGAVNMKQTFRKKEETAGFYDSPYGRLEMKIKTDNIEYIWQDKSKKGRLFLSYVLTLQGQPAGRYSMTITFREEQK
jgi:uncharacterized beta-barrel protein YwiB (DUF1934 family)